MTIFETLAYIAAVMAAFLGVTALVRRAKTLVQWAFLGGMLLLSVESVVQGLNFRTILPQEVAYWQQIRLWVLAPIPGVWLLFSLTYSRGNYRQFLAKWMPALVLALGVPIAIMMGWFGPVVVGMTEGEEPYEWIFLLSPGGRAMFLAHLVSFVLILMNLERTFRASVGTKRWRVKYMIMGLGLLFAVRVYTSSQSALYSRFDVLALVVNHLAVIMAALLIGRSILREGLFTQDIYPSQRFVQFSLTGVLVGIYFITIGLLSRVINQFEGTIAYPLQAFFWLVAVTGLTILILSERIRNSMKRFVSRHLQRPFYDYRLIWTTFVSRAGSSPDRDQFFRAVVGWLSETVQVMSISIWVKSEVRPALVLGASTSIADGAVSEPWQMEEAMQEKVRAWERKPQPFRVSKEDAAWACGLARHNPNFFKLAEERVFVPIASGGQFLGLMVLGDRVNHLRFTVEDMELLKGVADQIAANLLNFRLSDRLAETRELEAFQTMSAFFVHDLKNTASTLSLMLKNMPAHFDDPEFRRDALRGLGRSVDRINDLIGRLSMIRQELELKTAPADPAAVVESALAAVAASRADGVRFLTQLDPSPQAPMDAEQIRKVVTNLLANAVEATADNRDRPREVRVRLMARDSSLVIEVADNGCGMTPAYQARSLFRPFQTTKNKGIGIGLFLSKRIVEAHGGTLTVESDLGKGTAVCISLPARLREST